MTASLHVAAQVHVMSASLNATRSLQVQSCPWFPAVVYPSHILTFASACRLNHFQHPYCLKLIWYREAMINSITSFMRNTPPTKKKKKPTTWLGEHLDYGSVVTHDSLFFSCWGLCSSDWCVATAYLSMESTISSVHPLILFCASKWVMLSVGSPSIAKIMSPMHRLAWAALLPGLTCNIEQKLYKLSTKKRKKVTSVGCTKKRGKRVNEVC